VGVKYKGYRNIACPNLIASDYEFYLAYMSDGRILGTGEAEKLFKASVPHLKIADIDTNSILRIEDGVTKIYLEFSLPFIDSRLVCGLSKTVKYTMIKKRSNHENV
jgi:hypothetical protein